MKQSSVNFTFLEQCATYFARVAHSHSKLITTVHNSQFTCAFTAPGELQRTPRHIAAVLFPSPQAARGCRHSLLATASSALVPVRAAWRREAWGWERSAGDQREILQSQLSRHHAKPKQHHSHSIKTSKSIHYLEHGHGRTRVHGRLQHEHAIDLGSAGW